MIGPSTGKGLCKASGRQGMFESEQKSCSQERQPYYQTAHFLLPHLRTESMIFYPSVRSVWFPKVRPPLVASVG